jgi:glycosyltransferase involved in cell wall biosynthesis
LEKYFPLVFAYLFPGLFFLSVYVYIKHRKEIEVIHAHGLVAATIALLLKKIFDVRVVVSTHAIYSFNERPLLGKIVFHILRQADFVLAVGEPSRDELIALGIHPEKVSVHPNWVNLQEFMPFDKCQCRRYFGLPVDAFIVLFLGRLIEKKGPLLLIEAAAHCDTNVIFVFAGDGPLAPYIETAARSHKNIIYLGRVEEEGKAKLYSAVDLFASPVTYNEGYATVYLEAVSCGTPVLSTKRGCLPYFLSDEVSHLMEIADTPTILNFIKHYKACSPYRETMVQRCRNYALNNFSDANASKILSSYKSVKVHCN